MSGFDGFKAVKESFVIDSLKKMENLFIKPISLEKIGLDADRYYLQGVDINTQKTIKLVLSDYRKWDKRPSLLQKYQDIKSPDDLMVFHSCVENRNGFWEANMVTTIQNPALVVSGEMSVTPPFYHKEKDSWGQIITHMKTEESFVINNSQDVLSILENYSHEIGKSSFIVRGWHQEKQNYMSFEIPIPMKHKEYLTNLAWSEFLKSNVWIKGLNLKASGEKSIEIINGLLSNQNIVWEMIPKSSYLIANVIAESAALDSGRDFSKPYRFPDEEKSGYLRSTLVFVKIHNSLWPKTILPLNNHYAPLQESRLETSHVSIGKISAIEESTLKTNKVTLKNILPGIDIYQPAPIPPPVFNK